MADTERIGGVILTIEQDTDPSSPRENDNACVIYGQHRHYTIGDGEPPADELAVLNRSGIRKLARWVRRYRGAVAFCKLGMYDHSGVTFYPVNLGENGHSAFDAAGWDSGVTGYAYVTAARAAELGIDDPDAAMRAEIREYADWAEGNVWGYVVTRPCDHPDTHRNDAEVAACPHAETLDSCWGYIGDSEYALSEGRAAAAGYAA